MPVCRFCQTSLVDVALDLGASPLANSYIRADRLNEPETHYPLKVYFCNACALVQLEAFSTPGEIFGRYDYFSSFSKSWLEHAERYVAHMREDFGIGQKSLVVEIASNDGYLLQYFAKQGTRVLGIEPAENVAEAARKIGIPTQTIFWGTDTAKRLREEGYSADLILGNNVLAHVPDINDFIGGIKELLKPDGLVTMEFPHLLNLVTLNQFDTIYHEHFSYLSLLAVKKIFAHHGLRVFDVRELPTHGGSLRIYACHADSKRPDSDSVSRLIQAERSAKLDVFEGYVGLRKNAEEIKAALLEFLLKARREGHKTLGYGAAAKGNTMLNYAGIKPDLLPMVADLSHHKQGKYLPGSRIPVISPDALLQERPDYVLLLPWNLATEIMEQLRVARSWGGRFVTAVPSLKVAT